MAPRLTFLFLGGGAAGHTWTFSLRMDSLIAPLVPLRNVVLLKGFVHIERILTSVAKNSDVNQTHNVFSRVSCHPRVQKMRQSDLS